MKNEQKSEEREQYHERISAERRRRVKVAGIADGNSSWSCIQVIMNAGLSRYLIERFRIWVVPREFLSSLCWGDFLFLSGANK
jgi:hypothetical protein